MTKTAIVPAVTASATDDVLEKGSRAKFREFTNESAKDVPSSLQPDDEGK
jgi:hypothetical protein